MHERKIKEIEVQTIKEEELELVEGFGEIIKKAREKMNLSVKEFAQKLKIKENILKRIEAEELTPEEKIAKKIERELGIKILQKIDSSFDKKEKRIIPLTIGDIAKIE